MAKKNPRSRGGNDDRVVAAAAQPSAPASSAPLIRRSAPPRRSAEPPPSDEENPPPPVARRGEAQQSQAPGWLPSTPADEENGTTPDRTSSDEETTQTPHIPEAMLVQNVEATLLPMNSEPSGQENNTQTVVYEATRVSTTHVEQANEPPARARNGKNYVIAGMGLVIVVAVGLLGFLFGRGNDEAVGLDAPPIQETIVTTPPTSSSMPPTPRVEADDEPNGAAAVVRHGTVARRRNRCA